MATIVLVFEPIRNWSVAARVWSAPVHGACRTISVTGPRPSSTRGGASIDSGTGLRGIARRLAAFDGTLAVDSPPGGPTEIRMSLPCASSWPRTSPCSARA